MEKAQLTDSQLYALHHLLFEGGEDPEAYNIFSTLCPGDFEGLSGWPTDKYCRLDEITCNECWRKALEDAYK